MTSKTEQVFVWIWLAGRVEPVPAGVLESARGLMRFAYARSYLGRKEAINVGPELQLRTGWQQPGPGLTVAGCLRDGSPDAWGRRVIEHRLGVGENELSELDYMIASGSNRFGALDFQASPNNYVARDDSATLDELHGAARSVQQGLPLGPALEEALVHGTSIGGARPKVLVNDPEGGQWLAKLSATSDHVFSVVNAEATAMELARRCGIRVPETRVVTSLGRDVLLVRRFDRVDDGGRRHVLSALTVLGLDELAARYADYPTLAAQLRANASTPHQPRELFERIVFNVSISNSDDHARNHAVFWDGKDMALTPAYDLAPGPRSGETSRQAMAIGPNGERDSSLATCLDAAGNYGLDRSAAREIIDRITESVSENWDEAAAIGRLKHVDKERLRGRQILNPAIFYGYP